MDCQPFAGVQGVHMSIYATLRDTALRVAQAGGQCALQYFRHPALTVEWKEDESPVTVADRETEAVIKAAVLADFPDDGWIGEESDSIVGLSGRRWIVDPIDGTRNFVRGVPLWAVLVACEEKLSDGSWRVVASAVGIPALDEWYEAYLNGGARCNGQAMHVSAVESYADSLWCYESPGWFIDNGLGDLFMHLSTQTALQRGLCDAYGHMLVASGRAELVIEPHLSIWDVAATSLVVEEAGGHFSDLTGQKSIRSNNCVVSNGIIHQQALSDIKRFAKP